MQPSERDIVEAGKALAPGLDIDLSDVRNLEDGPFFAALARIRAEEPVFWSDFQNGWLLTRHEDVAAAFGDVRFSAKRLHVAQFVSVAEAERAHVIPNLMKFVPNWIINVDGAQHMRLRRLVMKAFSRKVVEDLRPSVQAIVDDILDEAAAKGEVEFIEEIAFRLPATVIMRLLGLPEAHLADLRRWAWKVTIALASVSPPRELLLEAEACMAEMNVVFGAEFAKRRVEPTPDLMTELLNAREDRDALSEDELLGMCHVLLLAGHDTTANSLGLGMRAWLAYPEQRRVYLDDPEGRPAAITELLRYIAMSSTQIRIVAEPVQVGGRSLKPGEVVFLMIAAANRDPKLFPAPDTFTIGRNVEASMTFAPGFHHCVGHLLARMELDVFFWSCLKRFPDLTSCEPQVRFTPNYAFRGLEQLRLQFG